jgi:alkylation response protein AidB-like acyl-CoA dehydrogenase
VNRLDPQQIKHGAGGSFLIEEIEPQAIFTVEDFSEEQRQIERSTVEFAEKQIFPQIAAIEAKNFEVTRRLLREAGDLGLMAVDVPEEYGGLQMDKVTSALIAEKIAICGSFSVSFSAHAGIGTLPLVWYGTAEQKSRYLPRLASGEWVAAYALSEASSGSDAMNIRTRATLSEDGKHYVLNGEKMWTSNAGIANLFTVFAKIDGEKFAAFLIETGTVGLTAGPEEHKMGIRGSSTCPLVLTDCRVPIENLLGEAGQGHRIAFNILNVGRYKLGAAAIGGAKYAFRTGVRYAKERNAFSKPIASFGLVQQMIADSASGIYAGESLVYRVIGAIDASLADLGDSDGRSVQTQKHIEEYAIECSIVKVWCSEMLERLVDQVVQLHGGYGYVEDYSAERAYRDSRINKIFEGTNEINRLIISGWMLKRAMQGRLALLPAIQRVMDEVMAGPKAREERTGELAAQHSLLGNAKKMTLFCAGGASEKFGTELADQQEIMGALADMIMEVLVLESAILRAEKMQGRSPLAIQMTKYHAARSFRVLETAAERILGAVADGDMLRTRMTIFRRFAKHEPENTIALGREIATAITEAGRYTL